MYYYLALLIKSIFKKGKKTLLYQILVHITHGETQKNYITIINLKYLFQHGMMNLKYQMNHI